MLQKIKLFVENSKPAQYVIMLCVGILIGAIFYPTKHIEERLDQVHKEELSKLNEQHSKELKTQQDELSKTKTEYREYRSQSESKIVSLNTQITTLKARQKTVYYKVVRPDGTIEEKQYTESELDQTDTVITSIQQEFKEKIDSIENKWEQVHLKRVSELKKEFASKEQEYKKTIDELHKEKIVDINKKSFGIEAGLLTNKDYYGHITYDVIGPIFLGAHTELGTNPSAGLGLGIRF